jgi:hypothetical protein
MSRTPVLPEVIRAGVEQWMETAHTSMPGTVVSYDAARGTAAVQPAFKRRIRATGALVDLPVLPAVPVLALGTAASWIRVPLAAGDTVLLLFAERSLERWMQMGGQVHPEDPRRMDLSDAVAIPGLRRPGSQPKALGAPDSLEVVHGRARLELTAGGKVKLGNDFGDLLGILDQVLGHLIALSTTNAVVGVPCLLSPVSIAQLTADQALLQKVKG